MPHLNDVFERLSKPAGEGIEADMVELERFVVAMYSLTSPLAKVNEIRKHMFAFMNLPSRKSHQHKQLSGNTQNEPYTEQAMYGPSTDC